MKFIVSKTSASIWNDENPCDEAYKDSYIRVDERVKSRPEDIPYFQEHPERIKAEWYDGGFNHRVENGHIKRDFVEEGWFVEIATLLKFIQFSNNNGPIIIRKFYHNASITEIEIYDDFRE